MVKAKQDTNLRWNFAMGLLHGVFFNGGMASSNPVNFYFEGKYFKTLIHENRYTDGYILNFKKLIKRLIFRRYRCPM